MQGGVSKEPRTAPGTQGVYTGVSCLPGFCSRARPERAPCKDPRVHKYQGGLQTSPNTWWKRPRRVLHHVLHSNPLTALSRHSCSPWPPGNNTVPSLTGSPLLLPKVPSRKVFCYWNMPMSISPRPLLAHLPHCQPLGTAGRHVRCLSCPGLRPSPGRQVCQGRIVLVGLGTLPVHCPRKLHQQRCCSWYLSANPHACTSL